MEFNLIQPTVQQSFHFVTTLGKNTARNGESEDVFYSEAGENLPEKDRMFRASANVPETNTPRKSSRTRVRYEPFQMSYYALIASEPENADDAINGDENIHWKRMNGYG